MVPRILWGRGGGEGGGGFGSLCSPWKRGGEGGGGWGTSLGGLKGGGHKMRGGLGLVEVFWSPL